MPIQAIVGANWGDEGKGKITDHLAAQADFVVRFQGGSNAGHTVINDLGRFALHILPSGVFYPHVTNVIGPAVALDLESLFTELDDLDSQGVPVPTIRVSDRAQLLLPIHRLLDTYEEERLGAHAFGSTKSGIAPFYADKALKVGIQVSEIFDEVHLADRIGRTLAIKNALIQSIYEKDPITGGDLLNHVLQYRDQLEPLVCDATDLLHNALADGRRILLEGQLGALRDPDHGIHPYPTSSSTLAGYGSVGAGVPPWAITEIIAVTKAYSSCVGAGPFVTELGGDLATELRERGGDRGEYGATTGRPRRVGWFDAVATRYGCRVQGATAVALTNLDVLGYLDRIPIATAYRIDGELIDRFPARIQNAVPVLETLEGWNTDLTGATAFEQLPTAARAYVNRIETLIDLPIRWVSVGPHRNQLISR